MRRRRHRRAGLGVSHSEAEDNPDQGAKECAHDQELAATAGRSAHKVPRLVEPSSGRAALVRPGLASMPLIVMFSGERSD